MLWFRAFAVLLLFKSFSKMAIADSIHLPHNHTTTAPGFKEIGNTLSLPIRNIPYINLLLRAKYQQQDAENIYTRWFLQESFCPLRIELYDLHYNQSDLQFKREHYAIVVDVNLLNFVSHQRAMQKATTFFFILVDDEDDDDDNNIRDWEELHKILHFMWTKHTYKNYVLSSKGVLIYDPFEYNVKRGKYGQITTYSGERKLSAILRDMRGYPLRIQMFKSVHARPKLDKLTGEVIKVNGVDGNIASLLQKRLNFTMKLQPPNPQKFGRRNEDGTYNGVIGDIINNQIDMCLTAFFVKDYMVPEMTFTMAVYDDDLCIYVPKAERISPALSPLFSVRLDLWMGFFLTAFASSMVWCLIRWINIRLTGKAFPKSQLGDTLLSSQFLRIFNDTWVLWVRVNINRYPPFYSERVFVVSLCLVSVIFGAIFESSLESVYIKPMFFEDINTLKQLDESGLKIRYKYKSMADDLFFSEKSSLFASLNKKLTFSADFTADIIVDVAEQRNNAGVTRKSAILLESLHLILSKKIWMVPECPKHYTLSYVMPSDSPLEGPVNYWLLRALGAGLVKKWINDMHREVQISTMTKHNSAQATEVHKALYINDLQLPFYVVLFGSCLGGFLLILEILRPPRA